MTDRAPSRRSGVDTSVRTAAVWHTVDEHVRELSEALGRPLRVLDLGGGTGGLAVPLAEAGHDVIVVDPSPDALASLRRRATEQDVADHEHSVELSVPLAGLGSLWDPVPITRPTYVSTPLAPRTVRTIDLSAPTPPAAISAPVVAETPADELTREVEGEREAG